jgi:small-conductance mechanosensitive channel
MFAEISIPTETLENTRIALVNSFNEAYRQMIDWTPKAVAAVVLLVAGYVFARFVGRIVTLLADKLGLQTAADRSGLSESMQHMGIRRSMPAIVGTITFWLLMCVFFMAAFNFLELTSLSSAMAQVINYIPKLIVAAVVVVVGLLVASLVRGVVATSADRVGISYAQYLANACYYVLAFLTFIAAFGQLQIEFPLLEKLILIAFGALGIGFGLSFGLGGRDVMAGILAGYYLRQRLHAGDQVTVCGMEGTVREVGPTATIIETDEAGLLNRHSVPNTKMLNEAVR